MKLFAILFTRFYNQLKSKDKSYSAEDIKLKGCIVFVRNADQIFLLTNL